MGLPVIQEWSGYKLTILRTAQGKLYIGNRTVLAQQL